MDKNSDHFFNNFKCEAKVNLVFLFILKKNTKSRLQMFLGTRNQFTARSIKLLCRKDDSAKLKWNWIIESCSGKNDHKMEILQIDKFGRVCCFTQGFSYGLHGRRFTRNSLEKMHAQSTASFLKKIQDNPFNTICAFSVVSLFFAWKSIAGNKNV